MPNTPNLKSSGLKATLPRLKILEIFQNSSVRHLSAEDVYKILLNDNMDVGLATVYRVLTQFEQAEIIHRNHFETGKAVFELNEGSHHDHLVCLNCGKVEEFYDAEIEKRQHLIATEPEQQNGEFTGGVTGEPSFREGKIIRLESWMAQRGWNWDSFADSCFYSDSLNDLPLLARVKNPIAVDPDDTLRDHAEKQGWRIMSLR